MTRSIVTRDRMSCCGCDRQHHVSTSLCTNVVLLKGFLMSARALQDDAIAALAVAKRSVSRFLQHRFLSSFMVHDRGCAYWQLSLVCC